MSWLFDQTPGLFAFGLRTRTHKAGTVACGAWIKLLQTMARTERTFFDQDIDEKVSKSVATDQIRSKIHQSTSHHVNLAYIVVAVVTIVFV